jgi:hypothetical protein
MTHASYNELAETSTAWEIPSLSVKLTEHVLNGTKRVYLFRRR